LLKTYDAERRPVGVRNVRMATEFHALQSGHREGLEGLRDESAAGEAVRKRLGDTLVASVGREFRTMGLQIGYRYEDSPICIPDGTPAVPDDPEAYAPSARPGSRAPHVWLKDGRSILDLFGKKFTVLAFGRAETSGFEAAAKAQDLPLLVVELDEPEAAALYERRYVLVRPDGHVAWRNDRMPADAAALIERVRGARVEM
jgi:hypothetical protein